MATWSDDFSQGDTSDLDTDHLEGSGSTTWQWVNGSLGRASGEGRVDPGSSAYENWYYAITLGALAGDAFAQLVVRNALGASPVIRSSGVGGSRSGYLFGGGGIYRVIAGSYSQILSGLSNPSVGDTVRIEAKTSGGNQTIYALINGSAVGSIPDNTYGAGIGHGGVFCYELPITGNTHFDDFQYGDISGGTAYTQSLAGTLTSSGALVRQARKALAGTLTSSGSLAAVRAFLKAVAGTLTSSGALSRQTGKAVSGTLSSSGSLVRQARKALAGTLTSSGSLAAVRAFLKALAGTLTSSGALSRQTGKAVSGTLSSSGSLVRQARKALAGTLSSSGSLAKRTSRALAGVLAFVGSVSGVKIAAGAGAVADWIAGTSAIRRIVAASSAIRRWVSGNVER